MIYYILWFCGLVHFSTSIIIRVTIIYEKR